MIQLSLKRSGSPVIVHLNLPASSSAIAEASSQLDQASGAGKTEIVQIKSVIANLPSYLSGLDPDSRTQLAQLNRLSSIIAQMDSREQNIYAGALDGSSINNLNDVIRVSEQVSDYILIPNVNSDVTQHTELKQVYDSLALIPEVPEYAIRLLAGGSPMDSDGLPERQVYLNLPATQEALDHVLEVCEAPSWREMVFWVEDGAVPDLLENMDCDDIQELNELAKHLKCRENSGELSKLKAVILATDCHDVGTAIQISENLDDYLFEPDQRNPEEVASEELRLIVDEQSLSILKKHVSLYNYGLDVMAANNAVLTPYGLVQRRDGNELLQAQEPPSERSGMEMMQ